MGLAFDVMTIKLPCLRHLTGCFERNIVEGVNSSQTNLVVTHTADCTCHHLTNSRRKLIFPALSGEILNKYGSLAIANVARLVF